MKKRGYFLTIAVSLGLICTGCQKISLSKNSVGGSGPGSSGGSPPTVTGDWIVSFMYNDQGFDSAVTFSQTGKVLVGQGTDSATGQQFAITDGSVNGTHVHFVKKYVSVDPSRPPVEYNGELEYENDADYHGWKMDGHYKTTLDGHPVDDKWLAVQASAMQGAGQQGPGPEQQPSQQPESTAPPPPSGESSGPPPGSAPNLSGQWSANYTYNFKKITSKMWLEQDGGNIAGHGTDVNTNEKFIIEKGWYKFPKVTLKCKYVKGKNAAESRELTIKATVQGGPSLKGETQFGGSWSARLLR